MTAVTGPGPAVRRRIRVSGVVQGVGFRPHVHRLATELGLSGYVGNDTEGVLVEVEGPTGAVDAFETRLVGEAPPLARLDQVDAWVLEARGLQGFRIVESESLGAVKTFVSPDVAVCEDCLAEMADPGDRRYRYPFVNCTNCGPRFTITARLPYDRPNTTMSGFVMCPACRQEYDDPADRRFHAQPVACPECGPRIWFDPAPAGLGPGTDAAVASTDKAVAATQAALARGWTVAVKGLGGYHLACDARSDQAVAQLRRRKNRAAKPLAVMAADLSVVEDIAVISDEERAVLCSPARPIVLLRARRGRQPLSDLVAPGNPYIGVMLPYTPLHHLLFSPVPGAESPPPSVLVMTSGNLTDEPICYDDDDARRRLAGIADCWLIHDRPIHVPCDDSVVRVEGGSVLPLRRGRGYAPLPVTLPFAGPPILATGAELKNTFCLSAGRHAWTSQHVGDMGSVETLLAFERSLAQFGAMYQVDPEVVAADLHPGYQTRRWAEEFAGVRPVELVQHHHAHVAALMAEHGLPLGDRLIGVAFDGTGYGSDGAIWGGEILVAGYTGFERAAHLAYVPLPGGDSSITKPYRAALAYLWAAGVEWDEDLEPVRAASEAERAVLARQLERGFQCAATSSMGRLFDAVSALLGVRQVVSYEAQAAIELETVAEVHDAPGSRYHFDTDPGGEEIDVTAVIRAVVQDLRRGVDRSRVATGFHLAVAELVGDQAQAHSRRTGITRVGLTGGVFQNVLLVRLARAELRRRGLDVLTHRLVPPNDGGLALGQLAVAGARRVAATAEA